MEICILKINVKKIFNINYDNFSNLYIHTIGGIIINLSEILFNKNIIKEDIFCSFFNSTISDIKKINHNIKKIIPYNHYTYIISNDNNLYVLNNSSGFISNNHEMQRYITDNIKFHYNNFNKDAIIMGSTITKYDIQLILYDPYSFWNLSIKSYVNNNQFFRCFTFNNKFFIYRKSNFEQEITEFNNSLYSGSVDHNINEYFVEKLHFFSIKGFDNCLIYICKNIIQIYRINEDLIFYNTVETIVNVKKCAEYIFIIVEHNQNYKIKVLKLSKNLEELFIINIKTINLLKIFKHNEYLFISNSDNLKIYLLNLSNYSNMGKYVQDKIYQIYNFTKYNLTIDLFYKILDII